MIETAKFPKSSSLPIARLYLGFDSGICSRTTAYTEATTRRCRWWLYREPHGFESLHTHTPHGAQNDDDNSLKLRHNVASSFKQHCGPRVLSDPDSWSSSAVNWGYCRSWRLSSGRLIVGLLQLPQVLPPLVLVRVFGIRALVALQPEPVPVDVSL
jgi:hypothetical protein